MVLLLVIGLSACNEQNEVADEDIALEEQKESTPEPDETGSNEPTVYENTAFKEVVVTETENQFVVTGKAQVFEGVFQYKLSAGDNVILEDYYQTDGAPAWGEFTIPIDKKLVTYTSSLFELFVYSAKDGSKINVLEISLESN